MIREAYFRLDESSRELSLPYRTLFPAGSNFMIPREHRKHDHMALAPFF